jgi:hypothetical protein
VTAPRRTFAQKAAPKGHTRFRRIAQHNIWRAFSPPPQDVPARRLRCAHDRGRRLVAGRRALRP